MSSKVSFPRESAENLKQLQSEVWYFVYVSAPKKIKVSYNGYVTMHLHI